MDLEFYKLSGAGNDFVALTARPDTDLHGLARTLCRRGLSIGADGLFLIERAATADGPIRMHHFNADGGEADLCLNGARCAAALAFELEWDATASSKERNLVLETPAGTVRASLPAQGASHQSGSRQRTIRTIDSVRVQVPIPSKPKAMDFASTGVSKHAQSGAAVSGYFCNSGVPHVVRLLDCQAWGQLDLDSEGAWLRSHPDLGEPGANVNFVRLEPSNVASETESGAESKPLQLRTYERGVEGETLACGTGAVATAATLQHLGYGNNFRFNTQGGFELLVSTEQGPPEEYSDGADPNLEPDFQALWFLEGDARIVAHGTVRPGALL